MGYISWLAPAIGTSDAAAMSYYMIFSAIFVMGANLFFSFPFSPFGCCFQRRAVYFSSRLKFCRSATYKIAFGLFYISCFAFTSFIN